MTQARKPRKQRADSKEEAVNTFIAANKTIEPPADMEFTKQALAVFGEVISEFAKVDWTPHSIRLAALLARTISMMQDVQEELIDEGVAATSPRGTPCLNPKMSATNMMAGQIMSLRRSLALHAMAGGGKTDQAKRRGLHKGQEDAAPTNDDDLLNMPEAGHA